MNDNYVHKIAQSIRQKVNPDDLPKKGLDRLFMYYALLALSKAPNVTNEDVHNAWSAWASEYDSRNPSLVPFQNLDSETQEKDSTYRDAINNI